MAALTALRRGGWTWLRNLGLVAELAFHYLSGISAVVVIASVNWNTGGWDIHSSVPRFSFLFFFVLFVTFFSGFVKRCSITCMRYT